MADHSDSNNFAEAVIVVETDPVLEAYIHLEMALLLALVLGTDTHVSHDVPPFDQF